MEETYTVTAYFENWVAKSCNYGSRLSTFAAGVAVSEVLLDSERWKAEGQTRVLVSIMITRDAPLDTSFNQK